MADNYTNSGATWRADNVGGVLYTVVKLDSGDDGLTQLTSDSAPYPTKPMAVAAGGATPYGYVAAASANQDSQVAKASAGQVYSLSFANVAGAARYVKLYDVASSPTSGSTPSHRYLIPTGTTLTVPVPACGLAFGTGIAFRITTGAADSDATAATAGDVLVNIGYK